MAQRRSSTKIDGLKAAYVATQAALDALHASAPDQLDAMAFGRHVARVEYLEMVLASLDADAN